MSQKFLNSAAARHKTAPRALGDRGSGLKRQIFFFYSQSIDLDEPCSEVLLPSKILHRVVFCIDFGDLYLQGDRTVEVELGSANTRSVKHSAWFALKSTL